MVDTLIVKSKKGNEASKNAVLKTITQKNVLVKLTEVAKTFKDRNSGFTSLTKMGVRAGDGAMMVRMSLVGQSPAVSSSVKESTADKPKTEKPNSENRKPKTDNRKTPKKEKK